MPSHVHPLDLKFRGVPNVVASYLIPHRRGAVLIEAGSGSTVEALKSALAGFDFTPANITDVLLTHIHLDHAGAAGWLARHGARIHVHPNGAPHLLDPEKLIRSAARIYGDKMEELWGEFLPVPESSLVILQDGEEIEIEDLRFRAIDTPGHADHHFSYRLGDICFTGDVAGVRLPGPVHLRVPMPPPEFHLEKWISSVVRLKEERCDRIAPTHFGIFENVKAHLSMLMRDLEEVGEFMERVLPGDPPLDVIAAEFQEWTRRRSEAQGLTHEEMNAYETANPSRMSATGMQRYWRKFRAPQTG